MRPLQWGYCNKAIDFGYGYKALAKKALAMRPLQWGYCNKATAMRPLQWGYCNKAIAYCNEAIAIKL